MVYGRQKVLLALLEEFGGVLKNTEMQKFLFLLSRLQEDKSYHFVPYKFGCFSFQVCEDKKKLTVRGILLDTEDWRLSYSGRKFRDDLSCEERENVWRIREKFGALRGKELLRYVYTKYPYYAINSSVANTVLNEDELEVVKRCRPRKNGQALYTVGYEGKSLEEYVNLLLKENIKIICDVRRNAFSRKYGFSKKAMSNALSSVGIGYEHFPRLGIDSKLRKSLSSQDDYNKLFSEYEGNVLSKESESLQQICTLLKDHKRVGLTCFERLPEMCHRTRVAQHVMRMREKRIDFREI